MNYVKYFTPMNVNEWSNSFRWTKNCITKWKYIVGFSGRHMHLLWRQNRVGEMAKLADELGEEMRKAVPPLSIWIHLCGTWGDRCSSRRHILWISRVRQWREWMGSFGERCDWLAGGLNYLYIETGIRGECDLIRYPKKRGGTEWHW